MQIPIISTVFNIYKESFKDLTKEIWILAMVMFVNRAGSMVLAFMSIYLTDALGWKLTNAGIVLSVFGMGSLLGSYIGGVLCDRIGYFKVQVGSMFFGGLMFLVLINVTSFIGFCVTIFILSTITESFRPANFVAISEYSTEENVTRSFSLVRLAINLGYGVGPALGGIMIGTIGYASLFIADGLTCIAASIFLFLFLRKREASRAVKQKEEREAVDTNFSIWSDHIYMIFIISTSICGIVFFQLFSTAPVYMKDVCGLTESSVGFLYAFNGILIFLLEMPIVYLFEKKYDLMPLVMAGAILMLCSFLPFLFMSATWYAAFVYMLFISIGEIFNFPFGNSWAIKRADPNHKGKFMAVYSMAFAVSFIVSPVLGSYISDNFGWDALWVVMILINVLAILGYWYIGKLIKNEKAE